MDSAGERLAPQPVTAIISGSVAAVTVDCGARANYLSQDVLSQLANEVPRVAGDGRVETICLCGRSDSYILGAEISFFLRCIEACDLGSILDFTRSARRLLDQLPHITQTSVAWVRGPALGAGLEIALACDRIVAAPTAKFALPETGLGIYPGMGGTQRLPRRVGRGLAKWMIYTGAIVPASHALAIGLVDAIHPSATSAGEALAVLGEGVTPSADRRRFDALQQLFESSSIASLLDPSLPMPSDPQAVRAIVQLRSKAPIALRLAETIIDRGMELPLAAGLDEEFAHLAEVFATEDARIGLASIGTGRPRFAGR